MVYTAYTFGKEKNIVERTAPRAIRKPKVIGNINEIKANKVIKIPKVIGNIEEPKANRVIKIPKEVKVDDRHKRYLNPITLKYVLRPIYLAALRKIKKKDEEWHQKLKTFEEVSQKVEKKINDQQSWFPLKTALKNYTKSFGIKIINKNEPITQLNSTIDNVSSILKEQLNEMKGIKHIETIKLTFKKTTVESDKNESKMILKQLISIVKQKQ